MKPILFLMVLAFVATGFAQESLDKPITRNLATAPASTTPFSTITITTLNTMTVMFSAENLSTTDTLIIVQNLADTLNYAARIPIRPGTGYTSPHPVRIKTMGLRSSGAAILYRLVIQ